MEKDLELQKAQKSIDELNKNLIQKTNDLEQS